MFSLLYSSFVDVEDDLSVKRGEMSRSFLFIIMYHLLAMTTLLCHSRELLDFASWPRVDEY